jgi:hypothetical protein
MSKETTRSRPTVRVWLVRIAMFLAGTGFSCWLVIEGGQTRAGINAEAVGRVMTYMYLAAALVSLHAPLRLRWQDCLLWALPTIVAIAVMYMVGGNDHLVEMARFAWARAVSMMLFGYALGSVVGLVDYYFDRRHP